MSSGVFTRGFYQLDNLEIARVKHQPETVTAWNAAQAGPATVPSSAQVSSSRRSLGIHCRYVTAEWVGAPPAGYVTGGSVKLPVFTVAAYNALDPGDQVAYLGATIEILGKTAEKIR